MAKPKDAKPKDDPLRWPWNDGTMDAVTVTNQSIHEVMQQQVAELLENADLTEEQKQQILVALACPCCGGSGVSLSIKLKD
jgi:hypothetical protein